MLTCMGHPAVRIAALVPYAIGTTPSQRFRLEQWAIPLASRGIEIDFLPFADRSVMKLLSLPGRHAMKGFALLAAFARRLRTLRRMTTYDAVVLHRSAALFGPAILERSLPRRAPLIYDFDDAIFLQHTAAVNRWFGWLKFAGKTATICRLAHHVVVGNDYLAEYAGRYNARVTIVPTSIDTDAYRPQPRSSRGGPVIVGWTGSSTSQTHLELFVPTLRALVARRAIELRVISNRPPDLEGVPHVWEPWDDTREAEAIGNFDIGIMPMPDDAWSKGKCALKALQCMATGVATVASAVGANREVIEHGKNGLLASSPEEWLGQLERLIDDEGLRARLGAEARRTVVEKYSMARSSSLLSEVILDTVAQNPRRAQ